VLLLLVVLSGIGVASFHPEGYRTAHFFTGDRRAKGMAIFIVGGNLGFSLGPIMVTYLVTSFGLKGSGFFSIPGVITGIVFLFSLQWLTSPGESPFVGEQGAIRPHAPSLNGLGLLLLILVVTMRSWIQVGIMTFIPFYYINYLRGEAIYAGKLVFIFLATGAVGTLLGGPLADLWGVPFALKTIALMPIIGLLIAWFIPYPPKSA